MRSIHLFALPVIALCLTGAACKTTEVGFPDEKDVVASVAPKPKPGADILTPGGNANYNAAVEGWGDGVSRAAGRMCRFFATRGMKVDCPPRPAGEE